MASEITDFSLGGVSGFQFSHLYDPARLHDLHHEFWKFAAATAPGIIERFAKVGVAGTPPPEESETLIEVARVYGDFVAKLFQITGDVGRIKQATVELSPVFRFKNEFLKIRVFKRLEEPAMPAAEFAVLDRQIQEFFRQEPDATADEEIRVAKVVLFLLDAQKKLKKEPLSAMEQSRAQNLLSSLPGNSIEEKVTLVMSQFETWCAQRYVDPERRKKLAGWISFTRPQKLEFEHLVPTERPDPALPEFRQLTHLHPRDGFKLTDPRMNTKQMLREIDYCLYCHQREKDSCSKGFAEKDGTYKKNPLGIDLKGCPLDERISEMQFLRKTGDVIASLAMIVLDNPMCPGTGHRICNDCMKGCIFQKQDPVNIPEDETGVLTEVLKLPYGFEIYGLLTRFNPLNKKRPFALGYNGNNALVVGLGPAGYTLAHYLANEGFGVVGIDALKLEPFDEMLSGIGRPYPKPIKNFAELTRDLDERVLMGFGGVSEYGITVRWDKNFLTLIYLTLLRRQNLRFYGGVRFGGTLNLEDAWDLGFKHVALATGAGRPTLVDMKNNLSRGVRKASDFLMSLQLTGAFKKNSLANLQVRLPALIIGGGLTALDTATETLAYYPVQVEKILTQFETLSREFTEANAWKLCDEEERETLQTFLDHARALREERRAAEREKRKVNFIPLLREWGGVQVVYRKRLEDSPAYRLNHEEVIKAFEEGIGFIENMTPVEVTKDRFGAAEFLVCTNAEGKEVRLPARSISVAAGTQPNTIYERENPGVFALDERGKFFKRFRLENVGGVWKPISASRGEKNAFFLSYENAQRFVSFYGDNHPDYAGNVVKAMASAKHGAPQIAALFATDIAKAERGEVAADGFGDLTKTLDEKLVARVVKVNRLTSTIVEVIIKGHYAARKFEPGQFYRLQNFEREAHALDGYRLSMEGLALTGAWVDKEKDLLSLIVLEMGASSKLCALLHPGEPVIVMGPTGAPSEIPKNETVLLAGGGLGNAVLLSISRALKANGCKVIYFAGYRRAEDIFMQREIEEATDQMVWAVDSGDPIPIGRPHDCNYVGNIVQAMVAFSKNQLETKPLIPLSSVDRILAIGSDRMMAAVAAARHGLLKPFLKPGHHAIGSINSPMQCMMKEVCAQCLQRHVDPVTGEESFVFSCFNQDQELDSVDFGNLRDRLRTNSLAEKMTLSLVDTFLQKSSVERV